MTKTYGKVSRPNSRSNNNNTKSEPRDSYKNNSYKIKSVYYNICWINDDDIYQEMMALEW